MFVCMPSGVIDCTHCTVVHALYVRGILPGTGITKDAGSLQWCVMGKGKAVTLNGLIRHACMHVPVHVHYSSNGLWFNLSFHIYTCMSTYTCMNT